MSLFKEKFLHYYLQSGFGTLPKRDIDALVMHLLDEEGIEGKYPLGNLTNQQVSIQLKIPVARVKSLRYEAALKFGDNDEDRAKMRFLTILAKSTFEAEKDRIVFIMEDMFISKWVQGLLKEKGIIFDSSFNTEIIKIPSESFCDLLDHLYNHAMPVKILRERIEEAKGQQSKISFAELKKEFIQGIAKTLGGHITGIALSSVLAMITG